jgi:hypothetical protein
MIRGQTNTLNQAAETYNCYVPQYLSVINHDVLLSIRVSPVELRLPLFSDVIDTKGSHLPDLH